MLRLLSSPRWAALAGAGGFLAVTAFIPAPNQAKPSTTNTWAKDGAPLVKKYCMPCHSTASSAAGAILDKALKAEDLQSGAAMWEKALTHLRTGHMPPISAKQPTAAERDAMISAIQAALTGNCDLKDPGVVTIRRLNRFEYANTVRDLLQVTLDPTGDFPSDDVGNGFDNIGEVLSISPLLMERYLDAAEKLAEAAIVVPDYAARRYDVSEMTLSGGVNANEEAGFYANGEAAVMYDFPRAGDYTLKLTAWGQQAGPEIAKMRVLLGETQLKDYEVPGTRGKPTVVELPIKVTAKSRQKVAVRFINDYYNPNDPNPNNRDRNLSLVSIEVKGPHGMVGTLPVSHRQILFVSPPEGKERETARTIIERFGKRAYRRPVTEAELERLLKLYDLARKDGESYEHGIRLMVTAVLTSPHFIFRVELDNGLPGDKASPVGSHAMASRLSYFLWSTLPDDSLFALADSGELSKTATLNAQVDRMLKSPKAQALADSFAMQWLELSRLETRSPDPQLFPTFNEQLRKDLVTETKMFFMEVLAQDRPITDFIDGEFTYLNENLANHYGIAGVSGSHFRKVSLKGTTRAGVITQGSILTVTSNPTRTSPVKRGKWVLEQLLGTPPPPPPPGADVFTDEVVNTKGLTFRQKMEKHRTDPACANCHSKMDPLGFGLENFDAVGAWRTEEMGMPIDASGELPGKVKFTGPTELRKILLSQKDQFTRALTEKMLTYALGRGLTSADRCWVDEISEKVKKDKYKFSTLVKSIVTSDVFRMKRAEPKP